MLLAAERVGVACCAKLSQEELNRIIETIEDGREAEVIDLLLTLCHDDTLEAGSRSNIALEPSSNSGIA